MIFNAISILVSGYSIVAMLLIVVWTYLKMTRGTDGAVDQINRLAGSKILLFHQYYSYVATVGWLVMVASLVDLLYFQQFSHFGEFSDDPAITWFGPMQGRSANIYFLMIIMNVITPKAVVVLEPLSRILRQGPVKMNRIGVFEAWSPARPR